MQMPSRVRKHLRTSPWFTEHLNLIRSPLDTLLRTCGLMNFGNTCFINSCLQCLSHCEPFAQVMLHGEHRRTTNGFCALCEMKIVIADILQVKFEPSSAWAFASCSNLLSPEFTLGTQQDAHEFLRSLIQHMVAAEKYGCSSSLCGANVTAEITSSIEQVFNFTTKSTIICAKCGNKTERHERHADLCLKIQNTNQEQIGSLNQAMSYYFGTEELDGENAYMCDNCEEKVKAMRRVSLQTGPNVLVISLGRFLVEFDPEAGRVVSKKLDHVVQFTDKLDVTPYMHGMSPSEKCKLGDYQYRLSAFLYHIGNSTVEGHYVSNVLLPAVSSDNGQWWLKNDDMVMPTEFLNSTNAYLLFYTREDYLPSTLPGANKRDYTGQSTRRRTTDQWKGSTEIVRRDEGAQKPKKLRFLFPKIDMPRRKEWNEEDSEEEDDLFSSWSSREKYWCTDGGESDELLT